MMGLFKSLYYILDLGVRLTLSVSTGAVFQPCFQERVCAVEDLVKQESNKYENNYNYSSEWTTTFKSKGE